MRLGRCLHISIRAQQCSLEECQAGAGMGPVPHSALPGNSGLVSLLLAVCWEIYVHMDQERGTNSTPSQSFDAQLVHHKASQHSLQCKAARFLHLGADEPPFTGLQGQRPMQKQP